MAEGEGGAGAPQVTTTTGIGVVAGLDPGKVTEIETAAAKRAQDAERLRVKSIGNMFAACSMRDKADAFISDGSTVEAASDALLNLRAAQQSQEEIDGTNGGVTSASMPQALVPKDREEVMAANNATLAAACRIAG